MALLSKSQVLAAEDDNYQVVDIPEWGGEIRIRGLTGAEWAKVSAFDKDAQRQKLQPVCTDALMVVMGAIDDRGMALFTEGDLPSLSKMNAGILRYLSERIFRLSGIGDDEQAAMAKKLNRTPTNDSGTSSPAESPAS